MTKNTLATILVAGALLGAQAQEPSEPAENPSPAEPKTQARTLTPKGKRDPFLNPLAREQGPGAVTTCTTGKRCLIIDQVVLRGVVRSGERMIAVVENNAQRTYFLRENDAVFNGYVVKITGDSVIFRENVIDTLGQLSTREVVKRVNVSPV